MSIGKLWVLMGIGIVVIGLIVEYAPGLLRWFGRLPGDIRISGEHSFFFFPITSMLLISVVLTIIVTIFFKR